MSPEAGSCSLPRGHWRPPLMPEGPERPRRTACPRRTTPVGARRRCERVLGLDRRRPTFRLLMHHAPAPLSTRFFISIAFAPQRFKRLHLGPSCCPTVRPRTSSSVKVAGREVTFKQTSEPQELRRHPRSAAAPPGPASASEGVNAGHCCDSGKSGEHRPIGCPGPLRSTASTVTGSSFCWGLRPPISVMPPGARVPHRRHARRRTCAAW